MDPTAPLSFKALISHIIADMARALCERPNESKEQRFVRVQAATQMILGLLPRDVIEVMLAGHTVMFHDLITNSIHDTLQGQIDTMRRATRANIVALNRAFHMNLEKLAHYQLRPSQGTVEATGRTDAPPPERPPQPAPAGAPKAARPAQSPPPPNATSLPAMNYQPTPEQIAAVQANPEAMAA